MWIKNPCRISNSLLFLGTFDVPIYLYGEDEFCLIEGGVEALIPLLDTQFKDFQVDLNRITKLIVLHSHYDHLAIIPWLKRKNPSLLVMASAEAKKRLENPKFQKFIHRWNREMIKNYRLEQLMESYKTNDEDIIIDQVIADGEEIFIGNKKLKVFSTPGHSLCSISIYAVEEQCLFISDSGGLILSRDNVFPVAFESFQQYLDSLDRLSLLEIKILCPGHFGVLTDENVQEFFKNAKQGTISLRNEIQRNLREESQIDEFVERFIRDKYKGKLTFLPEGMFRRTFRDMALVALKERY